MDSRVVCKYCGSVRIYKFGTYKGRQLYYCKDCERTGRSQVAPTLSRIVL